MAESIGCDPAALAMAALPALGITHETTLCLNDDGGFLVSACLWLMLLAPSGEMKSPIFKDVLDPLRKLNKEEWDRYQKDYAFWAEVDDGSHGPEPPKPSPLIQNDVTMEALGMALARDPRGTLTFRDELSGWLGRMESYNGAGSGAAERAAWLEARNGGPHQVSRVTRKDIMINNLSSSVLGGMQPQKLAAIKGLTDDGLLQRFIPVVQHEGRFGNRHTDTRKVRADYEQLVRECHGVPATNISLSPEAADAMWELRRYLFDLAKAMRGVAPTMANFVNKLPGVAGNLTLIMHIAADPHEVYRPVRLRTIERVRRLICEFILPHAEELYGFIGGGWNGEQLRAIASYLLTSGKSDFISSDFTRNVRPLKGMSTFDLARAISPLVAGGWLDLDNRKPTAPRWRLCPGVAEAMKARRESEEREKQALSDLMGWKRRPH
jgi:hypothetical protein